MPHNSPHETKNDVTDVVESCNQFGNDLFSQLLGESGNCFFSPSSVSTALAMTFAGASEETAREMASVLRFSLPPDRLHEAFRSLPANPSTGGVELRMANRLWGQQGYHFLSDFLQTTENCYGAKLAEVDFQTASESARQQINAWVENQTAHKIKDLIPPEILDGTTRLVLTNAVYFLGRWAREFDKAFTSDQPFWTTPDEKHLIPMMRNTGRYQYGDFKDLQVLELPYRTDTIDSSGIPDGGGDWSMCILLPRRGVDLRQIEAQLSTTVSQQIKTLRSHEVNVQIPKFRIESAFSLNEALKQLGMKRAFSMTDADFSGMTDDPEGLFIAAALHKAFVDVNEKGTEAAAATAVVMALRGASRAGKPEVFIADRPFLFLIRDRATGLIHFMGRFAKPE